MSILFGILQAERHIVEGEMLKRMASATLRFAPDGSFVRASDRIGMGFQPDHTHLRSKLESSPIANAKGHMIAFDGRLDNSAELCDLLSLKHDETPDTKIVLESVLRWGEDSFSRFVGDWALALWVDAGRLLYLARDHAGTRTLYYQAGKENVKWGTHLESLLMEGDCNSIDESFAAAYLSSQPIRDLTPFRNILAVPPAHYLLFQDGKIIQKAHWKWVAGNKLRYGSDDEYDEHFFDLFRKAVERRTGAGAPIIAELSGGIDSSSIVCMSDHIRSGQGVCPADLIDTISYYDDSEPNWNEKPYFTAVEQARGKQGLHIEVSSLLASYEPPDSGYLWPGPEARTSIAERRFEDHLSAGKYRVILSGIGGDELLGGPPDPTAELADYLVSLRFRTLFRKGFRWALAKRLPLIHLIGDAGMLAINVYARRSRVAVNLPAWLSTPTRRRAARLQGLDQLEARIGYLPSSIDNGLTWWSILETLHRPSSRLIARREYRYPFLDRDLVDFLLRVPPSQLMAPGRRRLLMRRALRNLVPVEVLERRRKAYVLRGPSVSLAENKTKLSSLARHSLLGKNGFIDDEVFHSAIGKLDLPSSSEWQQQLRRAIEFELWMRRSSAKHSTAIFSS